MHAIVCHLFQQQTVELPAGGRLPESEAAFAAVLRRPARSPMYRDNSSPRSQNESTMMIQLKVKVI
jgi:hypothetical protein